MNKKNEKANVYWLGYAWFLGPDRSHLCISYNNQNEDKNCNHPLSWNSKIDPVSPLDPGIVDTLGIAGLSGSLRNCQSRLSSEENIWFKQVELLETGFERILADMITGVIQHIINEAKGKTYIIIQGPAFPKLLGRLSYRHIREHNPDTYIYFMTFRRRFLTPNPLIETEFVDKTDIRKKQKDFDGMISGPIPSSHQEAIARKYYILPKLNHGSGENFNPGRYCPLMLELFEQNLPRKADKDSLANFLFDIGIRKHQEEENDIIHIANDKKEKWSIHPDIYAFQKVLLPKQMLDIHRLSIDKLRKLLNEKQILKYETLAEEIIRKANKDKNLFSFVKENPDNEVLIKGIKEAAQSVKTNSKHTTYDELFKKQLQRYIDEVIQGKK